MLYNKIIRPFILRNEDKIDRVLDRVGAGAKELVDKAAKDGNLACCLNDKLKCVCKLYQYKYVSTKLKE